MLLEGLVVVEMAAPLLWLLGVTMPSLVQLTIQLSEEGASGLGEKAMWVEGGCCCCSSLWSCSRHSASLVWPRERAMDSGRRPRESGMVRALRSHLYRTTAASRCPRAHAHIYAGGAGNDRVIKEITCLFHVICDIKRSCLL